jgi:hypothetical protein
MRTHPCLLAACVFGATLVSCTNESCHQTRILEVVNKEIRDSDRDPRDYNVSTVEPEGENIYVGMSIKISPTYFRHYLINPKTCKIVYLRADQ